MFKNAHTQIGALLASATMRSVSLLMSVNILNAVIGFAISVITFRYVDPKVLGVVYPLVSIFMIINQFGDWGTSTSFIKMASTFYHTNRDKALSYFNAALKIKTSLSLVIVILCLPFSSLIAKITFGSNEHSILVAVIIAVSGLQIIQTYTNCSLQIEGRFSVLSFIKILPNVSKLSFLSIIIFLNHATLNLVLLGFILLPLLSFIVAIPFSNLSKILSHPSGKSEFQELFDVSKWIALSGVANAILDQIDVLMLTSMSTNEELIKLLAANRMAGMFPILALSLVTVLLPKVASMSSKKELNYYFRKTFLISTVVCLCAMALLPFSKWFIPLILGVKYTNAVDIFNVLMIGQLLAMMNAPISLVLYKLNKEPLLVGLGIIHLLIAVTSNWILIPKIGAFASPVTTILVRLTTFSFIFYQLWKEGIIFAHREEGN